MREIQAGVGDIENRPISKIRINQLSELIIHAYSGSRFRRHIYRSLGLGLFSFHLGCLSSFFHLVLASLNQASLHYLVTCLLGFHL